MATDPFGLTIVDTLVLLVEATENNVDGGGAEDTSTDTGEDERAPETAAVSEEASQDNSATVAGSGQNGGALDLGLIALLLSGIWIRRKAA